MAPGVAVVAWLVLGSLLVVVFGLLTVLTRAHEVFCVSVRAGRALVVRGRLPADALASIAAIAGGADAVLVRGFDREGDLVVEVQGVSDQVALRMRMRLAELTPEGLGALEPPPTTWWRMLGFVELAWWADSRLRESEPAPSSARASNIIPFSRPPYGVTQSPAPVRLVILDLGGVVFSHSFDRALEVWGRHGGVDPRALKELYHHDEAYALHEVDAITIEGYHRHVCATLGVSLSLDQFVEGWNAIFLDEVPGIAAVLDELAPRVTLVALSNTNRTHCAFMTQKYAGVLGRFSRVYYSHEIRARKPQAEAYQRVLDDWGVAPHEAVFADDLAVNVEGAGGLGLDTIHVTDAQALVRGLVEHGLVPPRSPL